MGKGRSIWDRLSSIQDIGSFRRMVQQELYDAGQLYFAPETRAAEEFVNSGLHELGILTDTDVHTWIRDHVLDANDSVNSAAAKGVKRLVQDTINFVQKKKRQKLDPGSNDPLPDDEKTRERDQKEIERKMFTSASSDRCCVDVGTIVLKGNRPLKKKIGGVKRVFNHVWSNGRVHTSPANKATWVWKSEFLTAQTLAVNHSGYMDYNDSDFGDGFNSSSLLVQTIKKSVASAAATYDGDALGNNLLDASSHAIVLDTQYKEYHFKNLSTTDNPTPAFIDVFVLEVMQDIHAIDTVISSGEASGLKACPAMEMLIKAFAEKTTTSGQANVMTFDTSVSDATAPPPVTATSSWYFGLGDAAIHGKFAVRGHKRFCLSQGQQGTVVVKMPKSQYLTYDFLNRAKIIDYDTAGPVQLSLPVVHQKGSYHVVYRFQGGVYTSNTASANSVATIEPCKVSCLSKQRITGRIVERTSADNVFNFDSAQTPGTTDADIDLQFGV